MAPTTAVMNQKSILTRSIHTALFILLMPPSISGVSWMYIDPNRPKTAVHRMKRTASQPKRTAVENEWITDRTAKMSAETALRTPIAVANPYQETN